MSKKQTGVALFFILLCSLILRTSYNFDRSMRFDEAFSMVMVTEFSWSEMMSRIAQDVHPPLYYVFLRLWVSIGGDSELTARLMSVCFGVMTVLATYLFCRDAFLLHSNQKDTARVTGIIAAIFVSVTSFQVHWSQEIRMYSLGTMLAMLSSWVFVRALQNTDKKWWVWYILLASAFLYTHYYALFTVASQGAYSLAFLRRYHQNLSISTEILSKKRKNIIFSFSAIALLFMPWLPVLWKQFNQVQQNYWIPNINVWTVSDILHNIFFPSMPTSPPSHFESALVAISIIALIVFLFKKNKVGMILVAYLASGPLLISAFLSVVFTAIIYQRYYIFSQLFILCGISFILTSFGNKKITIALSILITMNLLFFHLDFTNSFSNTLRLGTKGAAKYVLDNLRKDDLVLVSDSYTFPAVKYYTKSKTQAKLHLIKDQLSHYSGKPIFTNEDFNYSNILAHSKPRKIWLIGVSRNVDHSIVLTNLMKGNSRTYYSGEQVAFTQNWSNETKSVIVTSYSWDKSEND